MQWWYDLSEVVRNFGLVLGAAVGIYIAWRRVQAANKQAEAQIHQAALARRDHVAELGQVCRDFADLSDPVIRPLTTYLRENRVDYGDNQPPADVQEIMNILRGEKP